MADMPEPGVATATAFLEAHYYDGGLRVVPLGLAGPRPAWAPDGERVGFRDEFPLGEQDRAVEFYRLLHEGRALTWIGVFKRSVDRTFGDRRNHAGVGIWLLDQHVVEAEKLLDALAMFVDPLETEIGTDVPGQRASALMRQYLPDYLTPSRAVADGLKGWEAMSPEQAMTQSYTASSLGRPYAEAADQLLAASFLPAPRPNLSRAIILVSARPDVPAQELRLQPERVEPALAPALLKRLPAVMEQAQQRIASLEGEVAEGAGVATRMEQQLRDATASGREWQAKAEAAEERSAELQKQIEMSDTLKMLNRVCTDLDAIKSQTSVVGPQLAGIERALRQAGTAGAPTVVTQPPFAPTKVPVARRPRWATWEIVALTLVGEAVLALLAWGIMYLIKNVG